MFKKTLIPQAIVAATFAVQGRDIQPQPQPEPIDIETEYELIMQKKSKLSARKRRWVVYQFERMQQQD